MPGLKRPKHVAKRIFEVWNAWSITSAVSEHLCGICLSTGLTLRTDLVLEQTRPLVFCRVIYAFKRPQQEVVGKCFVLQSC